VTSGSSSVRVWSLTRWSAARLDQRVRSVTGPARSIMLRAWVVCALTRPVSATSASDQRDCSRIKCVTALFEGVRLYILIGRLFGAALGLLIILALL
jgi:hypothetical protein